MIERAWPINIYYAMGVVDLEQVDDILWFSFCSGIQKIYLSKTRVNEPTRYQKSKHSLQFFLLKLNLRHVNFSIFCWKIEDFDFFSFLDKSNLLFWFRALF